MTATRTPLRADPGFRPWRRFFRFLLFLPFFLQANDFILTYKIVVKDAIIYNETYHVSFAMTRSDDVLEAVCNIPLEEKEYANAYAFLKDERDLVLQCLFHHGVRLRDDSVAYNFASSSQTTLMIPPTRVRADVKEDFVTIGIISQP